MIKHAKPRNLIYYLKRMIIIIAAFCLAWQVFELTKNYKTIDVEEILNKSELKNKNFAAKVQKIEQGTLSAYFMEEHSNPIVSISFIFKNAGSAHDAENRQGLARLTSMLLTEGAGEYNSQEFRDTAAENGVKIGFSVSADDFSGALAFPKDNLIVAQKLLRAALYEPLFSEDTVVLKKQQLLTALKMQNENPQQVLLNNFKEDIFAGHPYARNALGKAEDIKNIAVEELKNYLKNSLAKDNLVVGIAGDLSQTEAEKLLNDLFSELPETSQNKALIKMELFTDGSEYVIKHDTAQAMTHFAVAGTYRDSIDFYPLYLANYIFGESGLSSRISKKIREEKGLTYGIYTYLSNNDATALIEGGYSATPENFAEAKKLLKQEWQKFADKGITEKELDEAKKSLINAFYLRFANIDDVSDMLVAMQKNNLGLDFLDKRNDYIKQLSLTEVNAAAKKYFSKSPDFVNMGIE